MLQAIRELVNYYSQKFHVPIILAIHEWQITDWNKEGILVGLSDDLSFGKSLEGKVIRYKRRIIARVGKQFLILRNQPDEGITRKMVDEALPRMARFIRLNQATKFMDNMKKVAEDIRQGKESSIQHNQWEIDRLSQEIHDLSRKIETDRIMLRFFNQSDDQLKIKATRTFTELNKLVPGLYAQFMFTENCIIGITKPITIIFEDHHYNFQPYQVEVNIREGNVKITGDDIVGDYYHPHVSASDVCWGNVGPAVSRMLGQVELHGLFSLIHNFLGSYNAEDPYQRIEKWDPDWQDDEDCEEPYCMYCDEYGHDTDNCSNCWYCAECMMYHADDEECPKQKEAEVEEQAA